ncbi:hypothetical protein EOE67_02150 [Rheinheimera riviphila]|uniref:Uncharacterized protein n=1 Tax=Rheinheimera riviphila TaxID=1834037 RepID=A0A437R5F1_9GAMM|nr:hypothetical protein [Rheinheimera riviphila]RVU42009.1 hypothetical protein EOE67_02150 [Rheinheimera riviphila]
MKKSIATVLFCASSIFLPKVFAGTAIIPSYNIWDGGGKSCFKISNISPASAQVNVKMYDRAGVPFNGTVASKHIINQLGVPFTLEPKTTASFCMTTGGSSAPGYGVIESQAVDSDAGQVFLVAHGYYTNSVQTQAFSISINGGLSF